LPGRKDGKKYEHHIPMMVQNKVGRIGHRLKLLQGDQSQRKWAKRLDVPQQNLSRYLSHQIPSTEFLAHLARKENINLNWLILGKGEVHNGEE